MECFYLYISQRLKNKMYHMLELVFKCLKHLI